MSDERDPERDQALPIPNNGPSMHDLVAADMMERKAHGLRKYGSLLQTGNGRSFLQDAYEEVLDLAVYLRGQIEEEKQEKHLLTITETSWFLQHTMSCRRAGLDKCVIHQMIMPTNIDIFGIGRHEVFLDERGFLSWES